MITVDSKVNRYLAVMKLTSHVELNQQDVIELEQITDSITVSGITYKTKSIQQALINQGYKVSTIGTRLDVMAWYTK